MRLDGGCAGGLGRAHAASGRGRATPRSSTTCRRTRRGFRDAAPSTSPGRSSKSARTGRPAGSSSIAAALRLAPPRPRSTSTFRDRPAARGRPSSRGGLDAGHQGAQGSGPGRVTLRALANPGAARDRHRDDCAASGSKSRRFRRRVRSRRRRPGCAYALLPASAQLDAAATEGTVSLATGSECPWTAASDQAMAVDYVGHERHGNAQITYRVTANDTGADPHRADHGRHGHLHRAAGRCRLRRPACTFDVSPNDPITATCGRQDRHPHGEHDEHLRVDRVGVRRRGFS